MLVSISVTDLSEPVVSAYPFTRRPGRHIAVNQCGGEMLGRLGKLTSQLLRQPPLLRFDDGTRVVSDKAAKHRVRVFDVPQVPSAVEWMELGVRERRRVPDVMQPRGGGQQVAIGAEDRSQRLGLSADPLGVRPASGQRLGQQRLCEGARPGDLNMSHMFKGMAFHVDRTNRPLP